MKTMTPWILMGALSLFGLANCSNDDDDDDGGGGTSGASAGKGGTSGSSGKGGSAGTGKGGSAGTAGRGGSAGEAGSAGSGTAGAGEAGDAGEAGQGGAAGETAGAGGDGTGPLAGAGGVAGSDGGSAGAGGDDGAAELTDARILHIVITANTGEIAEGQLALTRATAAAVLSFADEMVTEHGAANTDANALAADQAITPETNPVSEMLAQKSTETVAELTAVATAEFDVAYMEAQVAAHTEVLALIEDQLLPEADNAELVTFLGSIRNHVAAHLIDAETTLDDL